MNFNGQTLFTVAHYVAVAAIFVRIVMLKSRSGIALAWVSIVAAFPLAGVVAYIIFGDKLLSSDRGAGLAGGKAAFASVFKWAGECVEAKVDWGQSSPQIEKLATLATSLLGAPTYGESDTELIGDYRVAFDRIVQDIDDAQNSVLLEFYIWDGRGAAETLYQALLRARERKVACRILVDDVGARSWIKGEQYRSLREAGVEIERTLKTGFVRALWERADVRNHRKIVVVDGCIGYTGSLNVTDCEIFGKEAGVGEWIDSMVRIEGSAVRGLTATVAADWKMTTGEEEASVLTMVGEPSDKSKGEANILTFPTGPGGPGDEAVQMTVALVNAAEGEIVLTTPYFVPDVSLLRALRVAAGKGVTVRILVPKQTDSLLAKYAGESYFDELLEVGIEVYQFEQGVVHTKSICIDREISLFGTVNYDIRSLWINFEVSLVIFDKGFAQDLRDLQESYLGRSEKLQLETWHKRPALHQLRENTCRLISPLL